MASTPPGSWKNCKRQLIRYEKDCYNNSDGAFGHNGWGAGPDALQAGDQGTEQRQVPCIFLENEKGDAFQYYHTIFDTYKTVRFDSYEPVFRLVRDFVEQY